MIDIEEQFAELNRRIAQIDERLDQMGGSKINVTMGAVSPEGEVVEGPHVEFVEQTIAVDGTVPGESVAEWVSGMGGSPGYVVDQGVARVGPCLRIALGAGRKSLVYKRGIVGALDESQQSLYCAEGYVDREASPRQRERIVKMSEASKSCSLQVAGEEGSDKLLAYFSCLGKELRSKGVEL